jgi:tetratricopeptide (TPR) repeat protein
MSSQEPTTEASARVQHTAIWKKLFFVLIVCGVFFGFLELVLWISGAETQIEKEDPFRGFSSLVKVFEREDDRYKTRYVSLHRTFTDQSFRAEKPDNGFRIFSLGGSSSYGYPWGDEVAFTEILGELIAEEHPGLEVEAVNASGISYAMHRLNIVADELLEYDPDLFVIYSGHNEFIEPAFFESFKTRSTSRKGLEYLLAHWRLYSVARSAVDRIRGKASADGVTMEREVRRDQTQIYTPEEKREIVAQYRHRLTRLVTMAQAAGVRVLLATIPANLQGWRPEASTDGGEDRSRWIQVLATGRRLLKKGDYQQALLRFHQAIKMAPEHAETQFDLAQCYEGLGRWDEARQAYKKACDADASPIRRVEGINQAIREVAREQGTLFVDLDDIFEQQSKHGLVGYNLIEDYVHPTREGHEEIAWQMWDLLEQEGVFGSKAQADRTKFDRLIAERRKKPFQNDMPWFYNQGIILENQGQIDAAIEKFQQVVKMSSTDRVALLNVAKLLSKHGRAEEAIPVFEQLVTLDENNPDVYAAYGTALQTTGRDAEAIPKLRKAVTMKPDYPNTHNSLGAALAKQGKFQEAIHEFQIALKQNPDHASAYNNLGCVLQQLGRFREAAVQHRKSLKIDPENANAAMNLGKALSLLGLTAEAAAQYQAALATSPDDLALRRKAVKQLVADGNDEAALVHLLAVLDQRSDDLATHIQVGDLFLRRGQMDQALRQREKAFQLKEDSLENINNLAWLLATHPREKSRDGKRALSLATQAARMTDYKNAGVLDTLAAAYAEQGNFGQAVRWQNEAVELVSAAEKPLYAERLTLYQAGKTFRLSSRIHEESESQSKVNSGTPQ